MKGREPHEQSGLSGLIEKPAKTLIHSLRVGTDLSLMGLGGFLMFAPPDQIDKAVFLMDYYAQTDLFSLLEWTRAIGIEDWIIATGLLAIGTADGPHAGKRLEEALQQYNSPKE